VSVKSDEERDGRKQNDCVMANVMSSSSRAALLLPPGLAILLYCNTIGHSFVYDDR
jgi:hypothetical protein